MRLGHIAAAVSTAVLAMGGLAACGGSGSEGQDGAPTSGDAMTIGTPRQAPVADPCQWLSLSEAAAAMGRVGIRAGASDLHTVTNATGDGEVLADCWYLPPDADAGRLTVSLVSSEDAAASWRKRIEDLVAQGGREVVDHDAVQTSTRVADAPALQLGSPPSLAPVSCDVHVLLGDDAVVSVDLAAADSDRETLCAEATATLETVVDQLPEAG